MPSTSTIIIIAGVFVAVLSFIEVIGTREVKDIEARVRRNSTKIDAFLLKRLRDADQSVRKLGAELLHMNSILENRKEILGILDPTEEALYDLNTIGNPGRIGNFARKMRDWALIAFIAAFILYAGVYYYYYMQSDTMAAEGFVTIYIVPFIYTVYRVTVLRNRYSKAKKHYMEHELID